MVQKTVPEAWGQIATSEEEMEDRYDDWAVD